jgi:hypothetical protein
MKKIKEKKIEKLFNNPKMLLWEECNSVWFSGDEELSEEALKISNEINCYIPASSQDYWDQIDIRLYKNYRDKLKKYYSMDN